MKHVFTAVIVVILVVTASSFLWKNEGKAQPGVTAALPVVKFQPALLRSVSDTRNFSGRLEAVDLVDVRPKVSGTLQSVHFKSGQHVRQNDLLFTIDPEPYELQVHQAQANLAVAEEKHRLAKIEHERGRKLLESLSIARKEFDELEHAVLETASSLKGAQAELALAQLQLSYTQVRAPIAGRISRAEITAGNVVSAGGEAVPITKIVSDMRLYASFNVDEQSYLQLIVPSLRAGTQPIIKVGLVNDSGYPYPATIEAIDNQMDTRSGTVRVRARIDNVSPEMLPGLQTRIRLQGSVPYNAVIVDDSIVGTDQDRKFVLIVTPESKIEKRFVDLGSLQGKNRVLLRGISPGDKVVVDGAFKAPPGASVIAVDAGAQESTADAASGGQS